MTKWILTVEVEGDEDTLASVEEALDQIPDGSAYVIGTEESDEGIED